MKHRYPVRYRVTARRNNIDVAVRIVETEDEAQKLADTMNSVPHTDVVIEEVADPAETDATTLARETSEAIGWRRPKEVKEVTS